MEIFFERGKYCCTRMKNLLFENHLKLQIKVKYKSYNIEEIFFQILHNNIYV